MGVNTRFFRRLAHALSSSSHFDQTSLVGGVERFARYILEQDSYRQYEMADPGELSQSY